MLNQQLDLYTRYEEEQNSLDILDENLEEQAVLLHNEVLSLQYANVATEGLGDIIKNIFIGILNFIGKILYKIKSIVKLFSSLKSTEWDKYTLANKGDFLLIKNLQLSEKLENTQIPYPQGMKSTYFNVLTKIINTLQVFDMKNRSQAFSSICDTIYKNTKDQSYHYDVPAIQTQLQDVASVQKVFEQYNVLFDPKGKTDTKEFKYLFTNASEFTSIFNLLSTNSKYLYDVFKVQSNINSSNSSLKSTVDLITKNKNTEEVGKITKSDLLTLSNVCMFFAKTVDMYGTTVLDYHRVEHNFVEVCKLIVNKKLYKVGE